MACLVDQVHDFIKANSESNVIILTKVAGNGRRLLKQCAKKQLLLGVKAHTFISLAKELCGDDLYSESGSKLLDDNQVRDMVFQCVKSLENKEGNSFIDKKFFKDRSTAAMLSEVIDELDANKVKKLTGVKSSAPDVLNRMHAIKKVRDAYEKTKKETLWDKNDLLRVAATKVSSSKQLENTVVILLDDGSFSKLEKDFIEALKEKCKIKNVKIDVNSAYEPQDNTKFFRCRSVEVEERFIFRDILEKGYAAEDCVVVYLSSDYANGLLATAQLFGVDISLSGGIPFTQNKFYHLYKALRDWKYSEYSAEELYKLIYNKVLPLKEAWRFCRLLHTYNIGWGKARYNEILDFIQAKVVAEAKILIEKGEKLEAKQKLALEVEEIIPQWKDAISLYIKVAEENGSVDEQKENLFKVLEGVNRQDPAAYSIIKRAINGIEAVYEKETVLGLLLSQLESSNYLSSTQDKGKLLCLPLKQCLFTGRKYLYICGMSRFALQGGTTESPLLFDDEKKQLGLCTQVEREKLSERLIYNLLAEPYEEINISYNFFDTGKMIELQPAPMLRKLGGLDAVLIDYNSQEINLLLGDFIKKDKLKDLKPLGEIRSMKEKSKSAKVLEITDEAKKKHKKFITEYDKFIQNMVYSPSALEQALHCPFKFYLEKIIGLKPYNAPLKTDDAWLTNSEVGIMAHNVLEKYYSSLNGEVKAYDEVLTNNILEEEVAEFRKDRPDAYDLLMGADIEKARKLVKVAIEWTNSNDITVVNRVTDTEMAFGQGYEDKDVEVLIYEDGDAKESLLLNIHGKIDRVDEWKYDDKDITAIIDYKTGYGGGDKYKDEKEKTKVQPFIYALAVEYKKPGTKVSQSGYLFLNETKAELISISQDDEKRKVKGRLIRDIVCDWLSNKEKVLTRCAAFDIADDGHIQNNNINTVKHTKEAQNESYCSSCVFKDLCTEFFQENGLGDSFNYGK